MADDTGYVPGVPEEGLIEISQQIFGAVPRDPNDRRRQIALGWLAQLHVNVRLWNEQFIDFLKTYPGYRGETSPEAYGPFFEALEAYRRALDERTLEVKESLCKPLHTLHARFERDFDWMRKQDPQGFDRLRGYVDNAYAGESEIINRASTVIWDVNRNFDAGVYGGFEEIIADPTFLKWHAENSDVVTGVIDAYAERTREVVGHLVATSRDADADFTPIEDLAARESGSGQLVYVDKRKIFMGHNIENNPGAIIVIDSDVKNAFNTIQTTDPDLKAALEEIGKAVEASGNLAAGPVYRSLVEEAAKPQPDRSRLKQFWDGLVALAPGVKATAEAAAKVMALFV